MAWQPTNQSIADWRRQVAESNIVDFSSNAQSGGQAGRHVVCVLPTGALFGTPFFVSYTDDTDKTERVLAYIRERYQFISSEVSHGSMPSRNYNDMLRRFEGGCVQLL